MVDLCFPAHCLACSTLATSLSCAAMAYSQQKMYLLPLHFPDASAITSYCTTCHTTPCCLSSLPIIFSHSINRPTVCRSLLILARYHYAPDLKSALSKDLIIVCLRSQFMLYLKKLYGLLLLDQKEANAPSHLCGSEPQEPLHFDKLTSQGSTLMT